MLDDCLVLDRAKDQFEDVLNFEGFPENLL